MNLIPKEILISHLQRSEGAEEVSLPIDFFRDLVYQAMPRTWVGLTDEDDIDWEDGGNLKDLVKAIETRLRQKNT